MKNKISLLAFYSICLVLIATRLIYTDIKSELPVKVTTWDAFGYYMYLPSQFIYQDQTKLLWLSQIDSQYQVTGGELYQATKLENGNYVFKYLEGVSLLQIPFFLMAHFFALHSRFPADGFSAPYQYAVAWGSIIYCLLALFLLRNILLRYHKDHIVALTLLLLSLATNFIQYVSIDGGQSHAYIFPLYVLLLFFTIRWHESKRAFDLFVIGLIIGIACISRPTEVIMIFIPILWDVNNMKDFRAKWDFLCKHRLQIVVALLGLLISILPQLIYWKKVSGSWIYDVGSKWDFLNPHFRVLFGWEKGWFIYTPITILFMMGLFLLKYQPYKKSIITFCLLNIYIIISWHIWRYGASYSCRALVQSYPVFALPLAASLQYILSKKIRWIFLLLSLYLLMVNLFQVKQYNQTVLHYDDMNFAYYKSIYLNPNPTALNLSLLDTKDYLYDEKEFEQTSLYDDTSRQVIKDHAQIYDSVIQNHPEENCWLKITVKILILHGSWGTYIHAKIKDVENNNQTKIRLFNAISKEGKINTYCFYKKIAKGFQNPLLQISIEGNPMFEGILQSLKIEKYE